jgi:hypothetical protein
MGYNRILTPRAYVDLISYNLSHGWSTASNITVLQDDGSTAVTFDAGQKEDMFDLRPANFAQIAHDTQAFYIQYDTEFSSDTLAESNFLAILGHNFHDADVVIKVQTDDASDMGSPTTISTTGNHTKVINAAADSTADYIDPASNGWTLITWSTQTSNNQYVRITIEDDGGAGSNFDEDVQIGAILYGEYIDFPVSPDLSIQTSVDYDNTKLQSSVGGNTYANTASFGQPVWAATPSWLNSTTGGREVYSFERRYGRMSHSMNFSFMADTNLFAPNQHSGTPSDWFDSSDLHSQFYNKVLGQHNPFLFTIDKDSTTEGDYGLFRLADSALNATQVANRHWSVGLNLVETW